MFTHKFFSLFYLRPNMVFFGHFVPSRSVNTYIHTPFWAKQLTQLPGLDVCIKSYVLILYPLIVINVIVFNGVASSELLFNHINLHIVYVIIIIIIRFPYHYKSLLVFYFKLNVYGR